MARHDRRKAGWGEARSEGGRGALALPAPMVRSVLAHPQRVVGGGDSAAAAAESAAGAAAAATTSKTRVKKNAGDGYQGGSDQKRCVNEWLAAIARGLLVSEGEGEVPRGGRALWGLLLETQSLTTLTGMREACGLRAEHVVVPNPDAAECAALREAGCVVYEGVTHGLIPQLCGGDGGVGAEVGGGRGGGELLSELRRRGFGSGFDVVWLDYCGSIMTGSGRKRQGDILSLLEHGLIGSGGGASLFAITFSVRGSRNMYRNEVADVTEKLVAQMADLHDRHVLHHSTVTYYSRSGPIHTLAFAVFPARDALLSYEARRRARPLPPPLRAVAARAAGNPRTARIEFAATRAPCRRVVLLDVWRWCARGDRALWTWLESSAAEWRQPTPHCAAYAAAARVFARLAPRAARACALDAAMLPATKALRARGAASVDTVLEDTLHGEAEHPHALITNNYFAELTTAYDAVWLSYLERKSYPAKMLRRCHEWGDLRNLLQNRLLGSTLGLVIPYASAVEPWLGGCVDWIVDGVQGACRETGHPLLRPQYVSTWVLGTPHAAVVFSSAAGDDDAADAAGRACLAADNRHLLTCPPEVKQFTVSFGWDLGRAKKPALHGLRLKGVAAEVSKLLSLPKADVVAGSSEGADEGTPLMTVYEPGGFYLLPRCGGRAVYTAIDGIEVAEARRKGWAYVEPDALATETFVCLTNEGTVPFSAAWLPHVKTWLERAATEAPQGAGGGGGGGGGAHRVPRRRLIVLLEVSNKSLQAEVSAQLAGLCPEGVYEARVASRYTEVSHARTWELIEALFEPVSSSQ